MFHILKRGGVLKTSKLVKVYYKQGRFLIKDLSHGVKVYKGDVLMDHSIIITDQGKDYLTYIEAVDKESRIVRLVTIREQITPMSLIKPIAMDKSLEVGDPTILIKSNTPVQISEGTYVSRYFDMFNSFNIHETINKDIKEMI